MVWGQRRAAGDIAAKRPALVGWLDRARHRRTAGGECAPFPMRALLAGILLTFAVALLGIFNTFSAYRELEQVAQVELPLDRLSGTIVHLDEVLTMSARMAAATGDPRWEDRYRRFEPALDRAIAEMNRIAPEPAIRRAAARTELANRELVAMEHRAFDLARQGRERQARALLQGTAYEEQKEIYANAIAGSARVVQNRVDQQTRQHVWHAKLEVTLALLALLATAFGWSGVLGLVRRNIAERSTLEQRLAEAVRARDEFLSIASHELRTPLTAMQLQVQRLTGVRRRVPAVADADPLEGKLSVLERQMHRLDALVDALLDVARIRSGHLVLNVEENVDLAKIVRDVVERFEGELARAACSIGLRGIAEPVLGSWDAVRLDQVLSNLLANAVKYGAGKPIEVAVEAEAGAVQLSVRDHGIGISRAKQAVIFDRFERAVPEREYSGLGLGLWIVRTIVQAMNGQVSVASRPGEGATFRVLLQRQVTPAAASAELA
jgi:signal transduction histidine kinase